MAVKISKGGGLQSFEPTPFKKKKKKVVEEVTPKVETPTKEKDTSIGIVKKGSVATTADGRTFVNLSPQEVREIAGREALLQQTTEAGLAPLEEAKAEEALKVGQELAGEVGQLGDLTQIEKDKLSVEQAIKSSLSAGAGGVIKGAIGGGVAGAAVGGIGAIPGAIGGAIGYGGISFISGFRSNLKTQRKDMLTGEAANLRKQESNLLKLVSEVHRGGDPVKAQSMFNEQLTIIAQNHARLQLETTDSESLWLGEDGHTQLEKYEAFYALDGTRDTLIFMMQNAILKPNPSTLIPTAEGISE